MEKVSKWSNEYHRQFSAFVFDFDSNLSSLFTNLDSAQFSSAEQLLRKNNRTKKGSQVIAKMTEEPEAFRDSRFTAEISNRMRVPDRIMVVGGNQTRSPTFVGVNGPSGVTFGRDEKVDMKVPDRILVAGGDGHIAAKSTPFEMQVESAVLPPTRHEVRFSQTNSKCLF